MRSIRIPCLISGLAFILLALSEITFSQELIPAERRIDWSYAGIPGGIPKRTTICKTIDSATYGNGSTDASTVIQNALTSCPDNQVVYLPAGTYVLSKSIAMRSFDILRGAGPGLTTLKYTGTSTTAIIQVANGVWDALIGSPQTRNITQAVKDAKVVTLSSTSGITVGDVLLLNQLNDGVDVDAVGTNGQCTFCGLASGTRSLGQFAEVTAINGNQVSINVPLHWTYNTSLTPWAYIIPGSYITRWSGIEDLTLTQTSAAATNSIFLQGIQYFWIKNIEVTNIKSNGISNYYAVQSEFRDNYLHTAIDGYGNSSAYGIYLTMYSSNNLVENNIGDTLTAALATGPTSGNVFAYNFLHNIIYAVDYWMIGSPILNHGAHPKMNLWEGNSSYMVDGDFVWGSSSHNTIFRSQSAGWMTDTRTNNNAAVRLATKNRYMNFVGNVLGTPGKSNKYEALAGQSYSSSNKYIWVLGISDTGGAQDPKVPETTYRHGNFDFINNSTVWDPGNSNHSLPASLYLRQKPDWWCSETPWPPIGPDVVGLTNPLPAQRRFEGLSCTPSTNLTAAPMNLRIAGN